MSLYEIIEPKCKMSELVFPKDFVNEIDEIFEDFDFRDALMENDVLPKNKILLYGNTGCGKTSIAHAIAMKLKLKIHQSNSSNLVDSHLGSSEKNVAAVFNSAKSQPCVLLMDEFDSIASKRTKSNSSAGLANNRIVNTLLVEMESSSMLGVLVACTNNIDFIDSAILRRFDLILKVPDANRLTLKKIAEKLIDGRFDFDIGEILKNANTPSDVVRFTKNLIRRRIIEDEKTKRKPIQQEMIPEVASP